MRRRSPAGLILEIDVGERVAGGLLAYAFDMIETYRHGARQIAEILRGRKPSEIPYYQLTKFAVVINLKTAKALGLTIPPTLLATADEVIE